MPQKWSDKDVEKHWDNVAGIYIAENNKVKKAHDQRFHFSIEKLNPVYSDNILNVSSRDGEAAEFIRKHDTRIRITNAEISQKLINVAGEARPWLEQIKLDSYSKLPFPDGCFTKVLTLETLEHVAEPEEFLQELYRVSSADAIMVLSCPPATSEIPYRIFTALFGGHGEGPHKFPSSKQVKILLKSTKWKLIEHKGTVLLPVGPLFMQNAAEWIIDKMQKTFISELGIRQFYVCKKH